MAAWVSVLRHSRDAVGQRQRDNQAAQKNHHRLLLALVRRRAAAISLPASSVIARLSSQEHREHTEINQKN